LPVVVLYVYETYVFHHDEITQIKMTAEGEGHVVT